MQLSDWLDQREYGRAADLAKAITRNIGRPVSKQLLSAYKRGVATPPADVIRAIRGLTRGAVTMHDWLVLARSVGRTNVAPSGRPVRPYRTKAKAKAKRRSKR